MFFPTELHLCSYPVITLSWQDSWAWKLVVTFFSLNPKAFLQRGIYHGQLGFQVEAIADYDQSIALDSSGSVAYFNRGLAKARFRYTYDACFDLKKAYSLGIEAAENIYKSCCSLYHSEIDKMIPNQKH